MQSVIEAELSCKTKGMVSFGCRCVFQSIASFRRGVGAFPVMVDPKLEPEMRGQSYRAVVVFISQGLRSVTPFYGPIAESSRQTCGLFGG